MRQCSPTCRPIYRWRFPLVHVVTEVHRTTMLEPSLDHASFRLAPALDALKLHWCVSFTG